MDTIGTNNHISIFEAKHIQHAALAEQRTAMNDMIHRMQDTLGEAVCKGDTYYLILPNNSIKKRKCKVKYADGYLACDVYSTKEAAQYEVMRRKVFTKMSTFAQGSSGICEYEMKYDAVKNDIVIRKCGKPERHKVYFKTESDAYACILTTGESNIRKYYFGK